MQVQRRAYAIAGAMALVALSVGASTAAAADGNRTVMSHDHQASTATPIKHLVVIFDENISFDHYFGTYPFAANLPGEQPFHARRDTPTVNGLFNSVGPAGVTGPLLTANPNLSNPLRLPPSDPMTCDQGHGYTAEQSAADHGAEDQFAQTTGKNVTLASCLAGFNYLGKPEVVPAGGAANFAVMDYYDGNSVTALWKYAQHYAMSDNMFATNYGPSTPGALNVIAGQTYGATCGPTFATINDSPCPAPPGYNGTTVGASNITAGPPAAAGPGTSYGDADPTYDICSYLPSSDGGDGNTPATTLGMGGNNIGADLTSANVKWGWFEGGFDNGFVSGSGTPPTTAQICSQQNTNVGGNAVTAYIPHHEPFQYYASTANPMHLPPTSVSMVGRTDQANHQYDINDFWAAADSGNMPAVSYLKAPAYQDGHAGYSDPLDEQQWLVTTINHLESLRTWDSTAVVITYDDSDGWYDHVLAPITAQSQTALDTLTGTGTCGSQLTRVPVNSADQPEQGRCGLGVRMPFLVISPWAKSNFVDNTLIDQSSVVKFIEYNWRLPAMGNGAVDGAAGSILSMFDFHGFRNPPLFLRPTSGRTVARSGYRAG
jgi:phospholipase C